jgi:hypothetical protein
VEREYIFWRTGTGMLVFAAGFLLAPVFVLAIQPWLPDGPWSFLGAWSVVFVPFLRLADRMDERRLRRLRSRRLS